MNYTQEELFLLHNELYDILGEIIRICRKYDINYFIIGGTAIGAYYDKGILPWDDDLDIGMTRENYNRFLKLAVKELSKDYFLSWYETDIHTPFYYAKLKKNNTLFVEEKYKNIKMHHGIFVDIFPFDRIPNNRIIRNIHYKFANFLKCCFMGKEIWMWKYFGKCQILVPLERSVFSCFLNRMINVFFSKRDILKLNTCVQSMFNNCKTKYYNNVITKTDHISEYELENLVLVKFGPHEVWAPCDLLAFLKYNFPNLHRYTEEEVETLQCNHVPYILSFKIEADSLKK